MRENFDAVSAHRLLNSFGMRIVKAQPDRVFCDVPVEAENDLLRRFHQLEQIGELEGADASLHSVPRDVLDYCGADRATQVMALRGSFQGTLAGDQWILWRAKKENLTLNLIVEMDVDRHTPIQGAGFFQHLWMVVKHKMFGGTTDPFKTAEELRKAGINA